MTTILLKKQPFPEFATKERFQKKTTASIVIIHIIAIALAPFTFSYAGLIGLLIMYPLTQMAITIGYHRMLSHRSFKAIPALRYLIVFLAVIALQGGPIHWAGTHRLHHAKSDEEGDPHSPVVNSFFWGHMAWNFFSHPQLDTDEDFEHFVPDLCKDKGLVFFQDNFLLINIIFGFVVFGTGWLIGGWFTAISMVVWSGLIRIVLVWNFTWFVNSATHVWGYQNYDSKDQSRNNWWVAILTFGEGWHNNHHAYPQAACNQHRWHEFDMSYWVIYSMSRLGLVTDVAPYNKTLLKTRRKTP
jgi:stearoyl-CoA desaturase (delta-9 desaturase)